MPFGLITCWSDTESMITFDVSCSDVLCTLIMILTAVCCCNVLFVGLQQAVISGLSHLHYKQPLCSKSSWHFYGSLGLRCMSAMKSSFGSNVLPSLQLVCCIFVCILSSNSDVFNLCHDVDHTEIQSSGGGPHAFNLSYSWLGQNMSY